MSIQDLIKQAAAGTDFTQEKKGGDFERELPEAGKGVCRFREYIEIGLRDTKSAQYPDKKPAHKARFVFELTTPKHVKEVKKDDGTVLKIPHVLSIEVPISQSAKSNYIKLFRALNYLGTCTHPAQLLGKPYMIEVVHSWAKGDDPEKTKPSYANFMKDGVVLISAPRVEDPLTGSVKELVVPELLNDLKLFLWDNPTKESWDSLFIEGTREKDGEQISKNWLQERIMEALDFEGSALHTMLEGLGNINLEKEEKPVEEKPKKPSDKKPEGKKDVLSELGL